MSSHGDRIRNVETGTQEEETWADEDEALLPGLTILFHPDLGRVGERALLTPLDGGSAVELSRLDPVFAAPGAALPGEAAPGGGGPRPLSDHRLSRKPLVFEPAEDGSVVLRRGRNRGSVSVDGEPLADHRVLSAGEIGRGVVLLLGGRVVVLFHRLRALTDTALPSYGLIGESAAMVRLRQNVRRVADLDVPVLLRGETGTGKELLARGIHDAGPRRSGPLVTVNMAAIPPTLAAAELFGARKGAYTGADRRREGYFRRADGGTLFLDEIGETPAEIQPLLLRALEDGEIQPVGAQETERVGVRVVAATDADLEADVAAGRFRGPLLHRLSGFQMRLPPLRERREDFGRLFFVFLRRELESVGESGRLDGSDPVWLPGSLVARLAVFDWPGNVRQLQNLVRQLVISNRGSERMKLDEPTLELLAAPGQPAAAFPETADAPREGTDVPRRAADVSEKELVAALRAHRWQPHAAAQALGIPRASIYDLITKSPHLRTAAEIGREEVEVVHRRHHGHVEAMADEMRVSERGLRRRMRELGLA